MSAPARVVLHVPADGRATAWTDMGQKLACEARVNRVLKTPDSCRLLAPQRIFAVAVFAQLASPLFMSSRPKVAGVIYATAPLGRPRFGSTLELALAIGYGIHLAGAVDQFLGGVYREGGRIEPVTTLELLASSRSVGSVRMR